MIAALEKFLNTVLGPFHAFLSGLPPFAWRLSICGFILATTLWTLFLKRDYIYIGSPSQSRWCDLRLWVLVLLLPYLLIYLVL